MRLTPAQVSEVVARVAENLDPNWSTYSRIQRARVLEQLDDVITPSLNILPDGFSRHDLKRSPEMIEAISRASFLRGIRKILASDATDEEILSSLTADDYADLCSRIFNIVAFALEFVPEPAEPLEATLERWDNIDLDREFSAFFKE